MEIRGINPPRSRYYDRGQFGRLFPGLPPFAADSHQVREALLELGKKGGVMDPGTTDPSKNPENPAKLSAGFTYLGQFIDHDMTFDPTSSLERQNDPEAVANFRTPMLELDNVYGSGPIASSHLYDASKPGKLLIDAAAPRDVPRNSQLRALIGDPRNDENVIVSQLHVAFLKFHNAVVDHVISKGGVPRGEVFAEAQRIVRWHYQWMVVNEFLPHIVGESLVKDLMKDDCHNRCYRWRHEPFIPVEFAVAAYRFGHSQVKGGYQANTTFAAPVFDITLDPSLPDPNDLRGGRRAERRFVEWKFFFRMGTDPAPNLPQIGQRIDTKLSTVLFELPFGPPGLPGASPASLAQRNLLRSLAFGMPSGQDMARALRIKPLQADDLADVKHLNLDRSTPPWFYILREADRCEEGKRLGPVGGRIVAEVFLGMLEGDRLSYLRADPDWKPFLGRKPGDFSMGELLRFAGVA
ncbi:peroxidase family protein [Pyxidicoccus xibeiensis]|uniref:peroxidase family protein n=1 Tax=Pyxidicoccus xibeiensis TaxID=2906759 RepID=UPI0020A6E47E|nr:heme peroxidase family protein [Pyxidicoccus xibeiensis]MCP3138019.1 heme peroxidase family protein [Pyxidicoccus xibeiensis]